MLLLARAIWLRRLYSYCQMQHVSHHGHHFYETELGDVTAGSTVNALRVSHSSCQSLKERHWYTTTAARLISQIKWRPTELLPEVSGNHSLIESHLINIKDVRHTGNCRSENDKKKHNHHIQASSLFRNSILGSQGHGLSRNRESSTLNLCFQVSFKWN